MHYIWLLGALPQTPTGALPLNPAGGLSSPRPPVPTLPLNPGYATGLRIGLRDCMNLRPSFNDCFTKALHRHLNYFSITNTNSLHFTLKLELCQAYSIKRILL